MKANSSRIKILDTVRGLAIILMVIYHTCFDIVRNKFFANSKWLYSAFNFFYTPFYTALWIITLSAFLLIAGITSNFSRNNFKRAAIVLCAAFALTVFSVFYMPEFIIYFGILHCMGVCMLIYALLQRYCPKLLDKIPQWSLAVLFVFFFILTENISPINDIFITIFNHKFLLPTYIFGFYSISFSSADYYPLLPWIFMFFMGAKLGKYIKEEKFPSWFYKFEIKPFSFVGRYPLLIYLLHQPIIFGILYLMRGIL